MYVLLLGPNCCFVSFLFAAMIESLSTKSSVTDAKSSLGGCQRGKSKMRSALQGAWNRSSAVNDTLGTLTLHFCPPNLSQANLDQVSVQHFFVWFIYLNQKEEADVCILDCTSNIIRGQSDKDLCRTSPGNHPANWCAPGLTEAKMEESEQTCRWLCWCHWTQFRSELGWINVTSWLNNKPDSLLNTIKWRSVPFKTFPLKNQSRLNFYRLIVARYPDWPWGILISWKKHLITSWLNTVAL